MRTSKKFSPLAALCGILLGAGILLGGCDRSKDDTVKDDTVREKDKGGETESPAPKTEKEVITVTLPGGVPLVLVRIPAGSFQMGRYPDEQSSRGKEGPQHTVNIAYEFYMGKYEVTKAQWKAVMGATPWAGLSEVLDDPDSPAVRVTWNEIAGPGGFIEKLNQHLSSTAYRLPSEAEWEYACRAGTQTSFYWGDDPPHKQADDYAWNKGNAKDAGEGYAHVVGLKLPNAWGLYDMSGNVWEWCEDWWHGNYAGAPTDGSSWIVPIHSHRVHRGSAWNGLAERCRSAYRSNYKPDVANSLNGFRLLRTP